jgi:hypothetical protein
MKVELITQGEEPGLLDAAYREVDGHA